MITLSGLGHVAACPGSAYLPRVKRASAAASLGNAIHEMVADTVMGLARDYVHDLVERYGLDADDAGRLSFLASHLRLPVPAGALAEVPLGYFPDGTVRRVEGGQGSYTDEGQWLSGTLDAMWAEPRALEYDFRDQAVYCHPDSTLWVYDAKSGDEENVTPVDRNWQLRAGAVMAARWTGATRVIPAICYINAAECAEAVRAGRVYEGRWEVGEPLDAAALDAIEVELRTALARARGEGDGTQAIEVGWDVDGPEGKPTEDSGGLGSGEGAGAGTGATADRSGRVGRLPRAPLILGPHCEHCPARGACPAIAAEAVSLARGEGLYIPPGAALTPAAASWLAGILGPARRMLDAADESLRAHVRAHGPVRLADGREWGPVLEEVTRYKTVETFEALAAVVGDEKANEAFATSTTALRDAVSDLGRGAWKRLKEDIEARGGVVVGAREVFRKRWPAKPEEAHDAGEEHCNGRGQGGGDGGLARKGAPDSGPSPKERDGEPDVLGASQDQGPSAVAEGAAAMVAREPERGVTRAPCPACARTYALAGGRLRKHAQPGGGLRCPGSGQPPAQLEIVT